MTPKPFALSVRALILDDQQRCLLLRRAPSSKHFAATWEPPGGKCDAGEAMETALVREVREETGLQVQLTRLLGSSPWEMTDLQLASLYFEASVTWGEPRLSEEHDALEWVPRARLAERQLAPPLRGFLKAYAESTPGGEPNPSVDERWLGDQVDAYRRIRPSYEALARSLAAVLERATADLGTHGLVQARAKGVVSFAEKILRPGKDYRDPLRDLTDLCGARVVTRTLGGVAAVCRFIEDHFAISWPDSGDKLESLAASEFGYLSRHYVVAFKPEVFPADVVPVELVRQGLRAEIQVRTMLQHAWSDIHHELGYKNRFPLPRRWHRQFARLAAVLEEADREFEAIRVGLQEYASSYGTHLTPERLRDEFEKLAIVLDLSARTDPAAAHRLARMAMVLEDWDRAIAVLTPFADGTHEPSLRDLGISLCKRESHRPRSADFARGQDLLRRATEIDPTDADAWASLGGTWRRLEQACEDDALRTDAHERARACYRRAFEIDPTDPYSLGNTIEYEIADHPGLDVVRFFRPSIEAASRRCRLQAEVGMNLPWAFFDLGKFQLMLGQPYEALAQYCKGVENSTAPFFLDAALASFVTLGLAHRELTGLEWCRGLLRLARAWRFGQPDPSGPTPTQGRSPLSAPVAIVTGSCRGATDAEVRAVILDAFSGYRGTLISGGTEPGICGLVGEIQARCGGTLRTVGYAPAVLPDDAPLDPRYSEQRRTSGHGFSPLEPLQYWADLLASGVTRSRIRVLALGGGPVSAAECLMALAFGASVGLIEHGEGTEVMRCLAEPPWSELPALRRLHPDAARIREFLDVD